MELILALLGALAIGLSLGLLGSGGSILTVPVLVYVLGHADKIAIAESLAIVGGIALAGAIPKIRAGGLDWRSVGFFGVPAMFGAYTSAAWVAPKVPGVWQLVIFAVVMLCAAAMMFRTRKSEDDDHDRHSAWLIVAEGLGVGALTGLVGVGGGFMIVPALVLLGGLPMRVAVGTSLTIITMNASVSFVASLVALGSAGRQVDWTTIGVFIALGAVGTVAGGVIGSRVNQQLLKRIFAVFVLLMAGLILAREVPKAIGGGPEGGQATDDPAAGLADEVIEP